MKNNEPLNVSSGKAVPDIPELESADGMTPEELRLYREILRTVYPKPKRDIKAGVMDAIRRETSEDDDGKILLPSKKAAAKKARRELILKWGSLAASIVLVAGIGIRVLPAFLSNDMAVSENTTAQAYDGSAQDTSVAGAPEASSETGAYSTGLYKMMPTDSKSAGVAIADEDTADANTAAEAEEEPAAMMEETMLTAAVESVVEEEAVLESVIEEAPAEEAVVEEAEEAVADEAPAEEIVSGTTMLYSAIYSDEAEEIVPVIYCEHTGVFRDSYHEIPEYLIDEVGEDEYNAWANEVSREDSCAVNIYNFLGYFGITETTFVMYLQNSDMAYYCDYPVDVLYSRDADEVDAYYRGGGRYDGMVADYFEYKFKLALVAEIGVSSYTEWLGEFVSETVRGWSIAQFVRDHGITEARFLEIYDETAEAFREEFEGCVIHEYDTTKVFVPSSEIQLAISMSASGYQADVLCRK